MLLAFDVLVPIAGKQQGTRVKKSFLIKSESCFCAQVVINNEPLLAIKDLMGAHLYSSHRNIFTADA